MKEYALEVRELWAAHEQQGLQRPVEHSVVQRCNQIWQEAVALPIRAVVDAMIAFADHSASEARAEFEDCDILRSLDEEEQMTLTRLISLQTNRRASFMSNQLIIHPKNKIVQGRSRAADQTAHYEFTRRRKSPAPTVVPGRSVFFDGQQQATA